MWEIIIENLLEVLIVLAVMLAVYGYNKIRKPLGDLIGIQLAEVEAKHIAKVLKGAYKDHNELYRTVLNRVASRLKKKGVNLDKDELADIVYSTLQDVAEK